MSARDIVVMGASSGGIEALSEVLRGLPDDFPAAVFIVQHVAAHLQSILPKILQRETALPTQCAAHQARFERGHIYVAPPDRHLLVGAEAMVLGNGPRENRVRPAIDPLFRSAAVAHGARTIGVVLSGSLDDGTAGLLAIKEAGGLAVVQDPATAVTPDMPQSALEHVEVDHCIAAVELGALLGELTSGPPPRRWPAAGPGHPVTLKWTPGTTNRVPSIPR